MIYVRLKAGVASIGYVSPFQDFWESTKSITMPVICEMITGLAVTARQTRSSMLEVTRQDYIRTAWSKGLRERYIVMRHMLKNSLIPVITLLGIGIGIIFGGSVLVETVFAIPGVGRLLVTAVFQQDYVVVQSGVLVLSFVIMVNLIVDISYGWLTREFVMRECRLRQKTGFPDFFRISAARERGAASGEYHPAQAGDDRANCGFLW
jgi:peptide/nickel transport system permease protein